MAGVGASVMTVEATKDVLIRSEQVGGRQLRTAGTKLRLGRLRHRPTGAELPRRFPVDHLCGSLSTTDAGPFVHHRPARGALAHAVLPRSRHSAGGCHLVLIAKFGELAHRARLRVQGYFFGRAESAKI